MNENTKRLAVKSNRKTSLFFISNRARLMRWLVYVFTSIKMSLMFQRRWDAIAVTDGYRSSKIKPICGTRDCIASAVRAVTGFIVPREPYWSPAGVTLPFDYRTGGRRASPQPDAATHSASCDFNRVASVAVSVVVGLTTTQSYRLGLTTLLFLPESAVSTHRKRGEGLTGKRSDIGPGTPSDQVGGDKLALCFPADTSITRIDAKPSEDLASLNSGRLRLCSGSIYAPHDPTSRARTLSPPGSAGGKHVGIACGAARADFFFLRGP